jgi:16S rRNA (guanine966-N2)-methyltransferase
MLISETLTLWETSVTHLPAAPCPADLIFLDPPYHQGLLPAAVAHLEKRLWIGPRTLIVMETMAEESLELAPARSVPPEFSIILVKNAGKSTFTFVARSRM